MSVISGADPRISIYRSDGTPDGGNKDGGGGDQWMRRPSASPPQIDTVFKGAYAEIDGMFKVFQVYGADKDNSVRRLVVDVDCDDETDGCGGEYAVALQGNRGGIHTNLLFEKNDLCGSHHTIRVYNDHEGNYLEIHQLKFIEKPDIVPSVNGISWVSEPWVRDYKLGEDIDMSGAVIGVNYANGETMSVLATGSMAPGFDSSTIGAKTVEVSLEGFTLNFEVQVSVANKRELKALVAAASALNVDDYDAVDKASDFKAALKEAKLILADVNAVQESVDSVIEWLGTAMDEMLPSLKNWSYLGGIVDAAGKAERDIQGGKYMDVNIPDFLDALDAARLILAKPKSSQKEIDEASAALLETLGKLVTEGKGGILAAVDGATALYDRDLGSLLSDEGLDGFNKAYEDAVAALYDPNATQKRIDEAMDALESVCGELGLVAADTSALRKAVDDGKGMKSSDYTDSELFAAYKAAYDNAVALLGDAGALQAEADRAIAALQSAKAALNSKVKSSASLSSAISSYKAQIASLRAKYVASDVDILMGMIASAEKLASSADSTQAQFDAAAASLANMRSLLRPLANKAGLAAAIAKAEKLVLFHYTAKSLAGFKQSLAGAKLVNANMNLGTGDQAIVASAEAQLKASMEGLVYNAKKLKLAKKPKALKKGNAFQLKIKVTPVAIQKQVKLTYKSSNKKIATVSATGKIKAKKKGKATITVTAPNGKTLKIKISVK
jgi:hypothetical protein